MIPLIFINKVCYKNLQTTMFVHILYSTFKQYKKNNNNNFM